MRQRSVAFVHPNVLRAAAVIALGTIACVGLSACARDDNPAVSGSSVQKDMWKTCPNQPDYSGVNYRCH